MAEHYDTIVLGGSYAGLTSALTLGRANRRVLVIDAGNPRNRASKGINNLPGNDGISAAAWKDNVLKELAAKYRTVRVVEGTATAATRVSESPTRFEVVYTAKHSDEAIKVVSKTVILAMGASHAMPAVLDRLPVDQSTWWGSRWETSAGALSVRHLAHSSSLYD